MKKLIIHIGYPKTATSSFQSNVLSVLSDSGEIDLLNHVGCDNPMLGNIIIKNTYNYILGMSDDKDYQELDNLSKHKNALTVFSCESLSHVDSISPNASHKYASLGNLERLFNVFSPYFQEIELVMSIRSQKTIIPAYYIQEYFNIIREDYKLKDIGKWIQLNFFDPIDEKKILFNYHETYNLSSYIFGNANTHVLIYEDLKYDKYIYFNKLSTILGIDKDRLRILFESKNINSTIIQNSDSKRTDIQSVRTVLSFLTSRLKVPYYLKMIFKKIIPNSILKNKSSVSVKIRNLSLKEENQIVDRFRLNNLNLFEELNFDKEKMKRYGYL